MKNRQPPAGTIAASPRFEGVVANPSLDRTSAERPSPDRPGPERPAAPRPPAGALSVAAGARDHTLGRPDDSRLMGGLFWMLIIGPAVLAAFHVHPLVGLALVPLQLLAAILVGTAVARSRQCGALTLAALPLSAIALTWSAATLF